jgi:hypothetical protein
MAVDHPGAVGPSNADIHTSTAAPASHPAAVCPSPFASPAGTSTNNHAYRGLRHPLDAAAAAAAPTLTAPPESDAGVVAAFRSLLPPAPPPAGDDDVVDLASPDYWRRELTAELWRPGYCLNRLWRELVAPVLAVHGVPPVLVRYKPTAEEEPAIRCILHAIGAAATDLFAPVVRAHAARHRTDPGWDRRDTEIKHTNEVLSRLRGHSVVFALHIFYRYADFWKDSTLFEP